MSASGGRLPEGWVITELGDLGQVVRGVTYKKDQAHSGPGEGLLPLLRATNITDRLVFEGLVYVPEEVVRPEQLLRKNDIVIVASSGSIKVVGKTAQLLEAWDGTFGAFCAAFRPSPIVSPRYIAWFLASPFYRARVSSLAAGSNINNLKREHLLTMPVPLPPRTVQDRIVAVIESALAKVEAGVALFARAARYGGLYERAVLQHALGSCVVPTNGDEGSGGLPPLPGTWEWSSVGDEGAVQLGRMLNKERSSGSHMRPYLRVANVLDDRLSLSDVKEMDFPPGEYERYLLHSGDILLNEGQSPELLGRAAMYRGERPGLCFQKTLLRFQAGPRVDPEFALLVFRHYLYAGRFRRESRITTGIGHLTQVRFAAMEFPVPPRAEQEDIVRDVRQQLDSAGHFDGVMLKAADDAAALKTSLLNDAFLGALSGVEPGDQPADALLATIRERAEDPGSGVRRSRNTRHAVRVAE
jgi:type I restriction enzyme, S subunit